VEGGKKFARETLESMLSWEFKKERWQNLMEEESVCNYSEEADQRKKERVKGRYPRSPEGGRKNRI